MTKRKIYILIGVLVIAGIAGVLALRYKEGGFSARKDIVVERNLTAQQANIYAERVSKAEEYLKNLKSKNQSPAIDLANAHTNLGQLYYGQGRLSKAEQEFNKALEYDNLNINTLLSLSLAQIDMKDFASARVTLERAREAEPANADIWLRYINLTIEKFSENKEDILKLYEQALKATARHVDVLSSYGQYLEKAGDLEGAKTAWKEAADKAPESPQYLQEYKRLGGK